jgi:hypothetical protein
MSKFILHTDENGTRTLGVIITENDAKYQVWFGGSINRKPNLLWVDKKTCKNVNKTFSYGT